MAEKLDPLQDAKEFTRDLGDIKSRTMAEANKFDDLSLEGKRKCMEELEDTIQTLQKIKKNLKEVDDCSPDKNVVQVIFHGDKSVTFTKRDFERSLDELNSGRRQLVDVPSGCIESVTMQDNFTLDLNRNLQPIRMCFIEFSTEEDVYMALRLKKMNVGIKTNSRINYVNVEFIQPTQSSATHKTFRTIGNSLARLGEIDKELNKIGAVRRQGGMPELKACFFDKVWYLAKIQECKAIRATGKSLDLNVHGPLASVKPVDSEALKLLIKTLYDEECDILIQLREFQLNGIDFDFKHPAY